MVGAHEKYETERACEIGVKSVAKNQPGAETEGLTTQATACRLAVASRVGGWST